MRTRCELENPQPGRSTGICYDKFARWESREIPIYIQYMYLGVTLEKKSNDEGVDCWTMSPEKYVKAAIENIEKKLGGDLPFSKGQCPLPPI
jgi:hypothetical protein